MPSEYFSEQTAGIITAGAGAYVINQNSEWIENKIGDYGGIAIAVGLGLVYYVSSSNGDVFILNDDLLLSLGFILIIFGIESI
jgi:hypothetical protein